MFDGITQKFSTIFKNIRGLGKITDSNIESSCREIRRTLLSSDVNFEVAKKLIENVKKKANGIKVLKSISPGQQFIKVFQDELINILGNGNNSLTFNKKLNIILLAGLQGAGKTTTAAKLAYKISKQGKSVFLIGADIYRPGAAKQLELLASKINLKVYSGFENDQPLKICQDGILLAKKENIDCVIIDTAGRLHVDSEMMLEIKKLSSIIKPDETLFVADGMMGQDAVNSAKIFNESLSLTGTILTKMDGDSKGGAAISINYITGTQIKFIGISEKIDGLELFDSKRIVDRLLGYGDIISIVEKAEEVVDKQEFRKLQSKIKANSFDLNDFHLQIVQLKKMGGINSLMNALPRLNNKKIKSLNFNEKQMKWTEAIINSMTNAERLEPLLINGSRRRRISIGCGRSIQEVNSLLKQFNEMKKMMKKFNRNNNSMRNMFSMLN